MKATGVVRKLDKLGRIVIPKEMRKTFELQENDGLEIYVENEYIVLKKHTNEKVCAVTGEKTENPITIILPGNGQKITVSPEGKAHFKNFL